VVGWHDLVVPPGGTATIQAQLTGPQPITTVELRLNQRVYARVLDADLRTTADHLIALSWPVGVAGQYRVNLFAQDGRGCSDTTGLVRTVIVP
jgi:hypothetical protein